MSDDLQKRSTSVAKAVDLEHQKSALDRALSLKQDFDRAKSGPQSLEQEKVRQGEKSSQTSHAPKPQAHLRPQGQTLRQTDKQIDGEERAKEDQRSRALSEAYKTRLNQQKSLDSDHERDKDNSDRS